MRQVLGELDRGMDRRRLGYAVEPEELIGAEAQNMAGPRRELGDRACAAGGDDPVEPLLPPHHPEDELTGKAHVAVGRQARVEGLYQFVEGLGLPL